MSFILDALKKSENERQRQIGPSLADARSGRAHSNRPWWVVAVAALLVVNLGVLTIVLTRNGDAKPAPAQHSSTPAATASTPRPDTRQYRGSRNDAQMPAERDTAASSPAVRSLAYEADPYDSSAGSGIPNPHLAAAAAVPGGPPAVRPIEAPSVVPVTPGAVFEPRVAQNDNEVLPSMGEIIAGGATLPDMHLDIHVYSRNPAERFVFVNMRKYTEGQSLTEGPTVEEITTDGVVLNQHGLRFLLPRP